MLLAKRSSSDWSLLLLLLLAAFLGGVVCGDETVPCTTLNECEVVCGGVTMVLNDSKINFPITTKDQKYNYNYLPCGGIDNCNKPGEAVFSGVAVCQVPLDTTDTRKYSLGAASSAAWTMTSTKPYTFVVKYTKGNGDRHSTITLIANNTNDSPDFVVFPEANSNYVFQLSAKSLGIASGGGNIAGPIGLVLISVFLLAVIIYLIAGALLMYFVKGARGIEIIPNYHFWKDFPFLLKDGMFFVISPCYKKEGYEKI